MDTHKKMRVHLSALVDGALPAADLELAMAALHTPDGQQTWELYYRIGDALRAQASPDLSDGFAARVAARLDAEAPPLRRNAAKGLDSTTGRRTVARASGAGRRAAQHADGVAGAASTNAAAGAAAKEELPQGGKAVIAPKPAIASVS
jgi:sigma-E factor negative regulatory protein RseA